MRALVTVILCMILAALPCLSAESREDNLIQIRGKIVETNGADQLTVDVISIRMHPGPRDVVFDEPRPKRVLLSARTEIISADGSAADSSALTAGAYVEVVGANEGVGTALTAGTVVVRESTDSGWYNPLVSSSARNTTEAKAPKPSSDRAPETDSRTGKAPEPTSSPAKQTAKEKRDTTVTKKPIQGAVSDPDRARSDPDPESSSGYSGSPRSGNVKPSTPAKPAQTLSTPKPERPPVPATPPRTSATPKTVPERSRKAETPKIPKPKPAAKPPTPDIPAKKPAPKRVLTVQLEAAEQPASDKTYRFDTRSGADQSTQSIVTVEKQMKALGERSSFEPGTVKVSSDSQIPVLTFRTGSAPNLDRTDALIMVTEDDLSLNGAQALCRAMSAVSRGRIETPGHVSIRIAPLPSRSRPAGEEYKNESSLLKSLLVTSYRPRLVLQIAMGAGNDDIALSGDAALCETVRAAILEFANKRPHSLPALSPPDKTQPGTSGTCAISLNLVSGSRYAPIESAVRIVLQSAASTQGP